MADAKDEIQVMSEKNTELVQNVQHWKMLAAQRENEKLDLMKELNEMRLKLARLRSTGNVQASKLDTALQSASEKALGHLVRASDEIARSIVLAKAYMKDRKEAQAVSPRWSAIGGTPRTEKIHRVPPMMIGGQSIQPVVSLSRTLLNTSNPRPTARSPNHNKNVTVRALPMHMLQDVYIPLTRIDAEMPPNNMGMEAEANNSVDSAEELGLDDSGERSEMEESQQMSDDDYDTSTRLDAVAEEMEPEDEVETPPRNNRIENPLEGPSWLLDAPSSSTKTLQSGRNLEPDSTTEVEKVVHATPGDVNRRNDQPEVSKPPRLTCEFSPTVRRRKRTSSPPPATPRRLSTRLYSPRPLHNRRNSNNGRVLKVMVAKMRLDSLSPPSSPAPPKRQATELELLDAPSPNGATVAGVIVSEATQNTLDLGASGEPARHVTQRRDRRPSQNSDSRPIHDSDRLPVHCSDRRPIHDSDSRSRPVHNSDSGSILDSDSGPSHDTRPRRDVEETRRPSQDAPDSGQDSRVKQERDSRENRSRRQNLSSRYGSHENRDSDSGSGGDLFSEGRSRRARNKVVSYQEKPLNRKMRR